MPITALDPMFIDGSDDAAVAMMMMMMMIRCTAPRCYYTDGHADATGQGIDSLAECADSSARNQYIFYLSIYPCKRLGMMYL
jgi:hypothetical protein